MKARRAALILGVYLVWLHSGIAAQLTFIARQTVRTEIDLTDEANPVTNVTCDWVFEAPQAVGDLRDALNGYATNTPTATVSNDIVARVKLMLGRLGRSNDTVAVVLP